MDSVFQELAKDYLHELDICGSKFIESIIPPDISDDNKKEIVDMGKRSTTLCIPLNGEEARKYKERQDFLPVSFVSVRDEVLYDYLFYKINKTKHKKARFLRKNEDLLIYAEEQLRKSKRNAEKKRWGYVDIEEEKGNLYITSDEFCSNARLLLELKRTGLNCNAMLKQDSVYWRGIRTNPPKNFFPEDYWYYEQETGTNLSLTLAAHFNEFFERYKGDYEVSSLKETFLQILCDCIKENYPYIAFVPYIDWKKKVMSVVCKEIMQVMVNALQGKRENWIQRLAKEIIRIRLQKPKENKTGAIKQEEEANQEKKTNQNKKLKEVEDKILWYMFSMAFNQLLCLFVIDDLRIAHIFEINGAFKRKEQREDAKFIGFYEELLKAENFCQICIDRTGRNHEEVGDTTELLQQIKLQNDCKYSERIEAQLSEDTENTSKWSPNRQDIFVFCDEKDSFTNEYMKKLRTFIRENKIFCEDEELTEEQPLKWEKQKDFPRSESDLLFIEIQRAISQAIQKAKEAAEKCS